MQTNQISPFGKSPHIDKSWTLFLDRDGVINKEKKEDYILNTNEFYFFDNVPQALEILNKKFGIIVIVTNQRGVGKGKMSVSDLEDIHAYMMYEIKHQGGRIDKIYFCTDNDNNSTCRKPNTGMALQAKEDFPAIDFSKTIMVGNKLSDMQFGRNAGMRTTFIATTNPEVEFPNPLIDLRFKTLIDFAKYIADL